MTRLVDAELDMINIKQMRLPFPAILFHPDEKSARRWPRTPYTRFAG